MFSKISDIVIITITNFIFLLCCGTCKWVIKGEKNLDKAIKKGNGVLISGWHGRFLPISYYTSKYMLKHSLSFFAIAGKHRDAARIASILKKWGYRFIRGSSNKGANNVLKDMKKHFSNNETICITSDGPKGPINIAKPSSIRLAMENNVTILPVSAISKRFWQINSWDKFIFPKPFSTIYMCVGDKINYKKENITNSYCSELISKRLITLQNINDNLIK